MVQAIIFWFLFLCGSDFTENEEDDGLLRTSALLAEHLPYYSASGEALGIFQVRFPKFKL